MKLGICMDGCEDGFKKWLLAARDSVMGVFTYLEVGVACGQTITSVREWLRDNRKETGMNFRVIGVDIPGTPMITGFLKEHKDFEIYLEENGIHSGLLQQIDDLESINFAFIDGCHGKKCAIKDFESVEKQIAVGGIVCFHDSCIEDQGGSFQAHCNEFINVRAALAELGLLDESRPGWKFVDEVHGDKSVGGMGMCFFQRDV